MDARLVFQRDFTDLWELPREYDVPRGWGATNRVLFDYNEIGRDENSYGQWITKLKESDSYAGTFNGTIMDSNICGTAQMLITSGQCLTEVLTTFGKCANNFIGTSINMPIYYHVFRKPTKLMIDQLKRIRQHLSLPELKPGIEPNPGAWGLYTPGYYLFALHFRMIPLGFEPLSVMYNDDNYITRKLQDLDRFWETATRLAGEAAKIAACRNETLLIYFATDDAENLRPQATSKLGKFGRVVFGLATDEVGHTSPLWTDSSEQEVDAKVAAVVAKQRAAAAPMEGSCSSEDAGGGKCGAPPPPGDLELRVSLARPARGEQAERQHRSLALAEWWVLANAQWLATTRYSSYSATAAAWGLGPGGRMERAELHGRSVFRIDWARDDCRAAGAADPAQAAACPNRG
jgi:hypothetical protein